MRNTVAKHNIKVFLVHFVMFICSFCIRYLLQLNRWRKNFKHSVFYPEIIIAQTGVYFCGHILNNFLIHSNYECPYNLARIERWTMFSNCNFGFVLSCFDWEFACLLYTRVVLYHPWRRLQGETAAFLVGTCLWFTTDHRQAYCTLKT